MIDQLMILAEGEAHASEGISPFLVGGGAFLILLCLLGITYLFSGLNQKVDPQRADMAHRGQGHTVHDRRDHGSHSAH